MVIDKAKGQRWFWTAEKVCLATYRSGISVVLAFSTNGMHGSLYLIDQEASDIADSLEQSNLCRIEIADEDGDLHKGVTIEGNRLSITCEYLGITIALNPETAETLAEILRWAVAYNGEEEENHDGR